MDKFGTENVMMSTHRKSTLTASSISSFFPFCGTNIHVSSCAIVTNQSLAWLQYHHYYQQCYHLHARFVAEYNNTSKVEVK
jgi:hypothetical protein